MIVLSANGCTDVPQGRSRWAQLGHVARVGSRVWSLRAALRAGTPGVRRV